MGIKGFVYKPYRLFNKNKLMMNTCYFEEYEEDNNPSRKIDFKSYTNDPSISIYTIIWYDCDECNMLMDDLDALHLEYDYINVRLDLFHKINTHDIPTFLLNDMYIGNHLFDIYESMYSDK
jgi:hypothetical protein